MTEGLQISLKWKKVVSSHNGYEKSFHNDKTSSVRRERRRESQNFFIPFTTISSPSICPKCLKQCQSLNKKLEIELKGKWMNLNMKKKQRKMLKIFQHFANIF